MNKTITTEWVKGPLNWSRVESGHNLTVTRYNAGGENYGKSAYLARIDGEEIINARSLNLRTTRAILDGVILSRLLGGSRHCADNRLGENA